MPAATRSAGRERLEAAIARLAAAGVDTARVDAEWLLAALLGVSRPALHLALADELPPAVTVRFADVIERRERREPLQQILGWEAFRGLRLRVTPAVLVPRPETELLVEWALALLPPSGRRPGPLVIDVGTGSGCIACALAAERPDLRVIALDASPAAAAVARTNVAALGLSARVTIAVADLFSGLGAMRADLIVSNPPYLPASVLPGLAPEVVGHEPPLALDGGPDGLGVTRRLVGEAPARLAPGGALVLETAGGAQARAVVELMGTAGFVGVATRADLAGVERFVAGRR
ncbi:MAG: peptide chain release factor N(5)-glutamine methyltransferase [Candidatus Rokubacteria bacterium]|nr:peptide chain release factor N(5)-glutamine methyltransferase [Candidatus Rokubacteria bacterium]